MPRAPGVGANVAAVRFPALRAADMATDSAPRGAGRLRGGRYEDGHKWMLASAVFPIKLLWLIAAISTAHTGPNPECVGGGGCRFQPRWSRAPTVSCGDSSSGVNEHAARERRRLVLPAENSSFRHQRDDWLARTALQSASRSRVAAWRPAHRRRAASPRRSNGGEQPPQSGLEVSVEFVGCRRSVGGGIPLRREGREPDRVDDQYA